MDGLYNTFIGKATDLIQLNCKTKQLYILSDNLNKRV